MVAKTKSESTGPRGEKKPKEPEKKPLGTADAPSATGAAPKARRIVKAASASKAAHAEPQEQDDERDEDGRDGDERDGDEEVVEVTGELVDDGFAEEAVEPILEEDEDFGRPRRTAAPPGEGEDKVALSRTDPLQAYLREVQRHPLLTPDEEKTLTVHYVKTGDVRTAARLVTSNLRLVVKLAYEYRRAYKNIMDLIQEGNIGLMQAVKRYDPYRGVKLSSYAAWWIRAYILRFVLNNWRLVKLGTTQAQRKLFFNLNKEKARLSALGIEPTPEEIAKRLSVDEKEVIEMDRRLGSGEASLDAPIGDAEGRAISRVELLPSATTGPDVEFERSEMGAMISARMQLFRETLKGKDVIIFDKRMIAEDPLTLQELGDEFGISRERVRQLEARLMSKLRAFLQEELGDAVGAM
jgi:RNA polymerase sigma-32 factor